MLCQSCGKNNASIHFTKIINGNIEEKHICEMCAKEGNNYEFELPYPFHELFAGLMGSVKKEEVKDDGCSQCGLTHSEFSKTGKFGCVNCFKVFEKDVDSLLKGVHGHNNHIGKTPSRINSKMVNRKEIESLKTQLEESIAREEFEKAAKLRDKIKSIKEKIDNSKE